jgi:NADPH:quinone reductase-like Zn-dependent oxidoreductase
MKAVVINKYGGNEVLDIRDVPRPVPGPDDVVIKVHSASVNPVDWKIRSGMTKVLTGFTFPKILGSECSGVVGETGRNVKILREGDHVIGFPGIRRLAAFAEYACVSEKNVFSKPENISFEQASTIPVAGLTALQCLRDLGHIAQDHIVLINGASGGVGHFAIQIAKIFGALVTGVCSSGNAVFVKELGADNVIDYSREDFTKRAERYDIIFDTVSKRSFKECMRVLGLKGIYINTLPTLQVLLNQFVTGLFSSIKAKTAMVHPNASDMEWMKSQIEAGRIRIVIDRTYLLEQIGDAFAYSETERARGKIVLRIG